ncbi:hypothetical protein PMAYCL1PPCAC_32370, partial [Pristionchus mayeri]
RLSALLLLATIGVSSSASNDSFIPPFVTMLTEKIKEEFFTIANSTELSPAQIDDKIAEWARRNGIEEKFRAFDLERRRYQNETLQKLDEVVNKLPSAVDKMRNLISSEALSGRVIKAQLAALVHSVSSELQSMVGQVMEPTARVASRNEKTSH